MIKKMVGAMVGVSLGGETLKMIGDSPMVSGVKSATQSLVSFGILKHTAKMFKW